MPVERQRKRNPGEQRSSAAVPGPRSSCHPPFTQHKISGNMHSNARYVARIANSMRLPILNRKSELRNGISYMRRHPTDENPWSVSILWAVCRFTSPLSRVLGAGSSSCGIKCHLLKVLHIMPQAAQHPDHKHLLANSQTTRLSDFH